MRLLQVIASLTLLARGWLTFRWDHPVRGLLWDENLLSQFLEQVWNIDWATYHAGSDHWITFGIQGLGTFWMLAAILPWLIDTRFHLAASRILLLASLSLVADSGIRCMEAFYGIGMFIEHALQCVAPLAVVLYARDDESRRGHNILRIAAALTFVGHGLYAVGFHPVPVHFLNMTMDLLRCSDATALQFLLVVGILDFVVAALVLLPALRVQQAGLAYMVLWGGATALARVLTYYDPSVDLYGLDPGIAQTLVRTAHWALPLFMLLRK